MERTCLLQKKKLMVKSLAKRFLSILLCVIVITCGFYTTEGTIYATQSMSGNFNVNFQKTGNGAVDIVSAAKAQLEKTQGNIGYTEGWCADFVCDCAKVAGISPSVIPWNYSASGGVSYLYDYMLKNCGAKVVTNPQAGDIVFYKTSSSWAHVAIVTDSSGNSIHGNVTWCTSTGRDNGISHVCTRKKGVYEGAMGQTAVYVRPNYVLEHIHNWKYIYYLETHPHKNCYQCTGCGEIKIDDNSSNYFEPCQECRRGKVIANDETGIPDKALYDGILKAADEDGDGFLTAAEAEKITELSISGKNITNLKGIEYCAALKRLYLAYNDIMDISALSALKELIYLDLSVNQVVDISPLRVLSKLEDVWMLNNQISDAEAFSSLTELRSARLANNKIKDVSPFASLPKLSCLDLRYNEIKELNSLAVSTSLAELHLRGNQITNVNGLCGMQGLSSLDVSENKIKNVNLSNLPSLTRLYLDDNDIEHITLNELSKLELVGMNNNRITGVLDIDLPVLKTLEARNNKITGVNFSNMPELNFLALSYNEIADLATFEGLSGISQIELGSNKITDISALSGLSNLKSLSLKNNEITDIKPLRSLTELESLKLSENNITDISVLENLTELWCLELSYNNIIDISAIAKLVNLSKLDLNNNRIKDISIISELSNLYWLDISSNEVTDISSLSILLQTKDLRYYRNKGNPIINTGNIHECVEYEEAVNICYLSEKDRKRVMEVLDLSSYDGKIICLGKGYTVDAVRKYSPYDSGYGYTYAIDRSETGDLLLKQTYAEEGKKDGSACFRGLYDGLSVVFNDDNVWLVYRGDISSSGFETVVDEIKKMATIEPFAKGKEQSDYIYDYNYLTEKKFEKLLKKNQEDNIVIQSNNNVSFLFKKNGMKAIENKNNYDFRSTIIREYSSEELPASVKESDFILKMDYVDSGRLPGKALVRIPVGTEYVGEIVSCSILNADKTLNFVQRDVVDRDGYITILQEYCADYVVMMSSNKLGDANGDGGIDAKDALAVLKYGVGLQQDVFLKIDADVNKDIEIDSKDALMILKYNVGILTVL